MGTAGRKGWDARIMYDMCRPSLVMVVAGWEVAKLLNTTHRRGHPSNHGDKHVRAFQPSGSHG